MAGIITGVVGVETRKRDAPESLTRRGSSFSGRAGMEQSIEPKFLRVGFIDFASIVSQTNYGRSHCPGYIIRWRPPKVSFSSLRFRGEYDQLSVANAVFAGRSGRKSRGGRKRDGGARQGSCRRLSFLFLQRRMRSTFLCGHARSLVRSSILSTEVSFGSSREACGRLGYMNVGRKCRSGPGKRKLEQLSTESNRRSPRGSSSVYL